MEPRVAVAPKGNRRSSLVSWLKNPTQEKIVAFFTLVMFLIFSLTLDNFSTLGNILTLVRSVSVLGILGIGMGIVVIARGLDLSQVAIMTIGSGLAVTLMQHNMSIPLAVILGLLMAICIGLANGFVIAFIEIPALFTTLASGILITGLGRTYLLQGDIVKYVPNSAENFLLLGQGEVLGIPVPIVTFGVVAFLAHLFLTRTTIGRFIYAHGDNADSARLTGIAVRQLTMYEYALCAVIGYIAGLILAASVGNVDTKIAYSTLIFDVVLVVVIGGISLIGGRGGIFSVLVGTALIGTLLNGMTILNLNNNFQIIIKGLVLLGAILLDNYLHPRDEETARQGDI